MESASAKPTTVRVWFDEASRLWKAQRWDGVGGICTAKRIHCGSPSFGTKGREMMFVHSRLKLRGMNVLDDDSATVDVMVIDNKRGDKEEYRVWYESVAGMWMLARVGAPGGIIRASRMQSTNRMETDGRFLRFFHAEIKIGTEDWLQTGDRVVDEVRIMPRSQYVPVPLMKLSSRALNPGR